MLSLAIGREGQNARLAARLTGWRIDIRSDVSVAEAKAAAQAEARAAQAPAARAAAEPLAAEGAAEEAPKPKRATRTKKADTEPTEAPVEANAEGIAGKAAKPKRTVKAAAADSAESRNGSAKKTTPKTAATQPAPAEPKAKRAPRAKAGATTGEVSS